MLIRIMVISILLFCYFPLSIQAEVSPLPSKNEISVAFSDEHPFGKFHGEVSTKWLPDGRKMELLDTLVFVDARGKVWDAPKGHIIDGASIPQEAWSLVGGPYSGKYRNASVIHDAACDRKNRHWKLVHRVFYEAMRASGVPEGEARLKYSAVYNFGPRWGDDSWEARLSEEEYQLLIGDSEKRSAYIDRLLEKDVSFHLNYGLRSTARFIKDDLSTAVNYGLRSTARFIKDDLSEAAEYGARSTTKYVKYDVLNDLANLPRLIRPYLTIDNIMMVLGGIVFLGILINLINVIRRIWVYSLGLLLILFVVSHFLN